MVQEDLERRKRVVYNGINYFSLFELNWLQINYEKRKQINIESCYPNNANKYLSPMRFGDSLKQFLIFLSFVRLKNVDVLHIAQ